MTSAQVLVVDDEPDIRELLEITLARMGLETRSVATLEQALDALKQHSFELCLTDMNLPDGNGLDLVKYIQEAAPKLPVAVITAYGSVDTAISALKSGAFDFVSKPIELERLRGLIQSALKLSGNDGENLEPELELLGNSGKAVELRRQISKLSRSQAPVYISGESGSGKELVARLIHNSGPRADRSFVAVNCGAIPAELMESEFFGHRKGSFTGAVNDKQGLFQAADGGTLFLDEVADLPLDMQVKLLRAIQEKSVRAVGDNHETSIDVRILSATHKNLQSEVGQNRFRQDLFYRINVIELAVPALRQRVEDIRIIGELVLQKIDPSNPYILSDAAWEALSQYHFPGNVRELQNILERACAMCESKVIGADDLGLHVKNSSIADRETSSVSEVAQPSTSTQAAVSLFPDIESDPAFDSLDSYLQEVERGIIERALQQCRWNKTAAAEQLGISFRALRYKLKKLDIK
ncbi:MAG: sigma-54-dependent transcriptional regulator [Pseudomonadales bacterium]